MKYAAVKALLRQSIGLDVASVGDSLIDRVVQRRLSALGLPDADAYGQRLQVDAAELQTLTEAVVVAETWFFRHPEAFAALANYTKLMPVSPTRTLRCLSVPCASGEEAYSLVIALLEAGWATPQLKVDAFDISEQALTKARHAVYTRNSFRNEDLAFREKYFVKTAAGYELIPEISSLVDFQWGNLLAPDFCPGRDLYDIIFCRNLLIYFDLPTQQHALAVLRRLLRPEGWLFVGPAEAGLVSEHGFHPIGHAASFGFGKGIASKTETSLAKAPTRRPRKPLTPERPVSLTVPPVTPRAPLFVPPPPPANARVQAEADLSFAREKADAGLLAEAMKYCETHLQQHGPSAAAYYLLGLTQDALGDLAAAEAHYRKAIYLEPQHSEALAHLGFLLEKQGDSVGASRLLARARRAEKKGQN